MKTFMESIITIYLERSLYVLKKRFYILKKKLLC